MPRCRAKYVDGRFLAKKRPSLPMRNCLKELALAAGFT
jgi:hypothetical protein